MLWTTICIKNRTNIYSYASLTCTQNANQRKTKKVHSHFWHSLIIATQKECTKVLFFLYDILLCFCFFIDIGIDFCFSELFLDHFVFVWIRFIKKISTIYQFIIKEMENEQLKELWNFLCLEYLLFPQFFPQQCERKSCFGVILKKFNFIYFGMTKVKFVCS